MKPLTYYKNRALHLAGLVRYPILWSWENINANQLLAVSTIVLVVIGYVALLDTRETLEFSQRAWLGPSDAKFDKAPMIDANGEASPIEATITLVNTGKSPATNVVFYTVNWVHPIEYDQSGELAKDAAHFINYCFSLRPKLRERVIFPSVGNNGYEIRTKFNEYEIDWDVVYGRKLMLVQSCAAYETFKQPHHSAYCYFYINGKTNIQHLNICGSASEAD